MGDFLYSRLAAPARTVVKDGRGVLLCTFTDGSYTVTVKGARRTLAEKGVSPTVTHDTYVRLLPKPFTPDMATGALVDQLLLDRTPDILAMALQYVQGCSTLCDTSGRPVAGDADYGPLDSAGLRVEGSDFNDYLGIAWKYGLTTDNPEANEKGCLDCSGFIRMVFGFRGGLPLSLKPAAGTIPRRSFEIFAYAPGTVIIAVTDKKDLTRLSPGDLVFFDADTSDGQQIDHVGIFLGRDNSGRYRFVSSRKSINGPTMGDYKGPSLLDGTYLYARTFQASRRL